MSSEPMTGKQRWFIGHLYDTREAPTPGPTGDTPLLHEYLAAKRVLFDHVSCTKRQASNIIRGLLQLPEVREGKAE